MRRDISLIHTLPVPEVFRCLETTPQGLTQAEAEARLQREGPNLIYEAKGAPLYRKFLGNFTHLMAILLWVGGIVGFVAQMPQLGFAIWMVNLINGAFSFWQEYKAEKATEALRQLLPHYVRVLRNGEEQRILAESLVCGDIMLLAEGDRVSADGRLVEESELRVDQSTLTGESHAVRKTSEAVLQNNLARAEVSNLVFAGTSIAAGVGRAVVFAAGMDTEFGKIARLTQSVGEELSPLQREMAYATKIVTVIAVGIGMVFYALAVAFGAVTLAEGFIFAMGMIVAFVPEGMLPTVTLALAMSTQRMAKRHALIKRLSAVETLGCTSVICTDKTGTLTENEMTVREIWLTGRPYTVTGAGYSPTGTILEGASAVSAADNTDLWWFLTAASRCNNARLLPPNETHQHWTILGDPTEAALLVAARKGGIDFDDAARGLPRVRELPFESRRKRMSTIHNVQTQYLASVSCSKAPNLLAFVKGAPREVLALCAHMRRDGKACLLDDAMRSQIMDANDRCARSGLRVLAVAMRTFPALEDSQFSQRPDFTVESVEHELTFLGLAAMLDPPRPAVAAAVEKCHGAGIRIIMITGDYGLTAESIGRRIGIIRDAHVRIITGIELDGMSDTELERALQGEVIFARVSPEHKLRVVKALQAVGHVVAVTGDGVNDAPALKKADIGVAMGVAGTDVAKEAADMILTDDNFASIVHAIEEGRAVYANIKKFITYIFTSNAPEAVPFILFVLSGTRIPLALNVMLVLSIDLGTDIMPALALGAEPPEPAVMDKPPRNLREHVINRFVLLRAYPFLGLIEGVAAMTAFYFQYWVHGYWGQWLDLPAQGWIYQSATAMALGAVVTAQIGNLFAQRTERFSAFHLNWFGNRLIWLGIAAELMLVTLIIYTPVMQGVFGTAGFAPSNWLFLFAWAPVLFLADELRKAWARRRR